jgi:predicted nucleotidyltransferase
VTLDEIRALGPQLAELCKKYGIAELDVFGSIARGEEQPGSDVDLLCLRLPGNDLGMSYFALQEDLESFSASRLTSFRKTACTGPSATRSWATRGLCMQRDALCVAGLIESTRAIRD